MTEANFSPSDPEEAFDERRKEEQRLKRARRQARLVFNCTVMVSIALLGVGTGLELGVGWGMATAGASALILAVYTATRLNQ